MCVIALPAAARAQSAIGGTVKDTSGAVLPGVTVEVASDVLIEKTEVGVDRRPGPVHASSTFVPASTPSPSRCQGFNTFKREGLELPSNFTATVNADMKVGALEESVTVSGSSPVVDVQSNQKTQVLSRDVLDAVPTGKTIQGLGQLVRRRDAVVARRRRLARDAADLLRGARRRRLGRDRHRRRPDHQRQRWPTARCMAYHNEAMIQEAVYQTAGGTAETITGGITMNLVPKDGGNRFAGGAEVRQVARELAGRQPDRRTCRRSASPRVDKISQLLRVQHRSRAGRS